MLDHSQLAGVEAERRKDPPPPSASDTSPWPARLFLAAVGGLTLAAMIGSLVALPPPLAERAAKARERLQASYSAETLDDLLALREEQIDLATAALLIEREIDPDLDVRALRKQIDALADRVLRTTPEQPTDAQIVGAMNKAIYDHGGYGADRPVDKKVRGLAHLLTTRRSLCVELSVLHASAGQRLGLAATLMSVPGHVFVRYANETGWRRNVECTARGAARTDSLYENKGAIKALSTRHAVVDLLLLYCGKAMRGGNFALAERFIKQIELIAARERLPDDLAHRVRRKEALIPLGAGIKAIKIERQELQLVLDQLRAEERLEEYCKSEIGRRIDELERRIDEFEKQFDDPGEATLAR